MNLPSSKELLLGLGLAAAQLTGQAGCETSAPQDAEGSIESVTPEYTVTSAIVECHNQILKVQEAIGTAETEFNRTIAEIQAVYTQQPTICATFDSEFFSCNQELTTSISFDPAPQALSETSSQQQAWNHNSIKLNYYFSNLLLLETNLTKAKSDLALVLGINQNLQQNLVAEGSN
jgi:hypothetical protein